MNHFQQGHQLNKRTKHPFGCGSKLKRRGKGQVLVHVSTYQGFILEFRLLEPQPERNMRNISATPRRAFFKGEDQSFGLGSKGHPKLKPPETAEVQQSRCHKGCIHRGKIFARAVSAVFAGIRLTFVGNTLPPEKAGWVYETKAVLPNLLELKGPCKKRQVTSLYLQTKSLTGAWTKHQRSKGGLLASESNVLLVGNQGIYLVSQENNTEKPKVKRKELHTYKSGGTIMQP